MGGNRKNSLRCSAIRYAIFGYFENSELIAREIYDELCSLDPTKIKSSGKGISRLFQVLKEMIPLRLVLINVYCNLNRF